MKKIYEISCILVALSFLALPVLLILEIFFMNLTKLILADAVIFIFSVITSHITLGEYDE